MFLKLLFIPLLAALAFGQDLPAVHDGKLHAGDGCLADAECGGGLKKAEQLQKQAEADKQKITKLTALLNWYQQQYFILQAQMIEQQVTSEKPAPKPKPNGETK